MIPEYTKEAIDRWVAKGIRPGSFVQAVLSNDLMGAYAAADDTNREHMFDIVRYVYNEIPAECQGSKERFRDWPDVRARRLAGGTSYDYWDNDD